MIDRSYLPFQSAREYQDTKMQKWMGFFLSEHASALSDDTNKVTYMSDLSLEKKLLLLSQVYAGQLRTRIQVIEKNKRVSYTGTIPSLTKDFILIKTTTGHINLKLKDSRRCSMNQLEFQRNHLQMDYYSESYQDFERDFYRYSNMNIPLTFLTDDILKTMATSRKNYFVLNKEKSRDNRDHFFIFEVSTVDENPLIYHYTYKKTTIYLAEK